MLPLKIVTQRANFLIKTFEILNANSEQLRLIEFVFRIIIFSFRIRRLELVYYFPAWVAVLCCVLLPFLWHLIHWSSRPNGLTYR